MLNIDKGKSVGYCITHSTNTKYHIVNTNQLCPLEKVNSMVDLGVCFDSNFTFRDDISEKKIINKAYIPSYVAVTFTGKDHYRSHYARICVSVCNENSIIAFNKFDYIGRVYLHRFALHSVCMGLNPLGTKMQRAVKGSQVLVKCYFVYCCAKFVLNTTVAYSVGLITADTFSYTS